VKLPEIEQRHIVAADGTKIGYQVCGNPRGPVVVLANGLGGTYVAFGALIEALRDHYRIVSWDYRGLYTSGPSPITGANTVAHQADDLSLLLAHEEIVDAVLVGWSMGVQVAFEMVRRHRARVAGICAINGTYGRAFKTVMGSRMIGQVIPTLLKLIKAQAGLVGRASKVIAGSDALINAMKRFGLVAESIDVDVFRHVAAGFQTIDWVIYSDLLARLDEHDAESVLATIDVPVSIVTGDRDLMTPPATAEHMHRLIPSSRMVVIRGGSHYTPVEYPVIIIDELHRLFDRIPGWKREAA